MWPPDPGGFFDAQSRPPEIDQLAGSTDHWRAGREIFAGVFHCREFSCTPFRRAYISQPKRSIWSRLTSLRP